MIFDRLSVLRSLFPARQPAKDISRRWMGAALANPALVQDLIRMGGLLAMQPVENGELAPIDPQRLAYEAGRRDLAMQLLAMMTLNPATFTTLLETNEP